MVALVEKGKQKHEEEEQQEEEPGRRGAGRQPDRQAGMTD